MIFGQKVRTETKTRCATFHTFSHRFNWRAFARVWKFHLKWWKTGKKQFSKRINWSFNKHMPFNEHFCESQRNCSKVVDTRALQSESTMISIVAFLCWWPRHDSHSHRFIVKAKFELIHSHRAMFSHLKKARIKCVYDMHLFVCVKCYFMPWWARVMLHTLHSAHASKIPPMKMWLAEVTVAHFSIVGTACACMHCTLHIYGSIDATLMCMLKIPFSMTYATWKVILQTTSSQFQFEKVTFDSLSHWKMKKPN